MKNNQITIYKNRTNDVEIRVNVDKNTIWLSTDQVASLFGVGRPAIVKHIQNVYKTKELIQNTTCSILEQVAKDGKQRKQNFYNLDIIISVGYRVNSQKATHFRIWATNILRKYIIQGYAINPKRLEENNQKYFELQTQIKNLKSVIGNESVNLDQSKELIRVIADYSESLTILEDFDKNQIKIPKDQTHKRAKKIVYQTAVKDINTLRQKLGVSNFFGQERDEGLRSALRSIFQTFDGKDLYKSLEAKAANLLYLIIKNHPFVDGNKRIGSFLFLRFLDVNGMLYQSDGSKLVNESTLVAIALLIAQSDMKDKEIMIKLTTYLLNNEKE